MRALPLSLLAALPLLLATTGCDEEADLGEPDHTYTTRGSIEKMPSDVPGEEIHIKHEAIDDFVNREGEVEGMNAMTMPFSPAEDVDTSKLSAGDKIRFDFEVRWDARPMLRIVSVDELPADTELEFRKAQPPE
ncbi:MAG: copper-binding protein [Polyangiales bacterium]